jgi:hypothetical protein
MKVGIRENMRGRGEGIREMRGKGFGGDLRENRE